MKVTFEQGWSARPFKEQFSELSEADARKLDEVNKAICLLYFSDLITHAQNVSIRNTKFPKMVKGLLNQARKGKGEKK